MRKEMKTEKLSGMVLEYVNEHNDRCTKSIFDKIIDCGYEDAFANDNRNRLVSQIVADELERCNYKIEVKAFRELIKGHWEVFS